MAVTPKPGTNTAVAVGGTPVVAIPANPNGGFITNPVCASDQGIVDAEVLYVNPVGPPGSSPGAGNGATFVLYPGQTWTVIAGQTSPTYVNAASDGHDFSAVYW